MLIFSAHIYESIHTEKQSEDLNGNYSLTQGVGTLLEPAFSVSCVLRT